MTSLRSVEIGQRFGRLTVTSATQHKAREQHYFCLCDCGNANKRVAKSHLTGGKIKSCGCLRRETVRTSKLVHGGAAEYAGKQKTDEYLTLRRMMARCHNPNNPGYKHYGARGIAVCDRWRNGHGILTAYECFLADMGRRPRGTSIDRIDNDKGYSPDNCRWATPKQQRENSRRVRWVLLNGNMVPLKTWAQAHGVDYSIVHKMFTRGRDLNKWLETYKPMKPRPRK